MNAHKLPFDTHEYIKNANQKTVSEFSSSRSDIAELKSNVFELKLELSVFKAEMKAEFSELKYAICKELIDLKTEIKVATSGIVRLLISLFVANTTILGTLIVVVQLINHR
jgi:hypothetical protein